MLLSLALSPPTLEKSFSRNRTALGQGRLSHCVTSLAEEEEEEAAVVEEVAAAVVVPEVMIMWQGRCEPNPLPRAPTNRQCKVQRIVEYIAAFRRPARSPVDGRLVAPKLCVSTFLVLVSGIHHFILSLFLAFLFWVFLIFSEKIFRLLL